MFFFSKLLFVFRSLFVKADGSNKNVLLPLRPLTFNDFPFGFHLANLLRQRCLFQASNIHPIPRIKNLSLQFGIRHQTITMK